jgi:hypothetical protein
MDTLRVVPAVAERWPQLGRVFGSREKDPTSCWCQRFRRHEEPDNRGALQREVHEAVLPVGLLAYLDDDVVGWTRVVPRWTLPVLPSTGHLPASLMTILTRGGCPASWCAVNTVGPASESRCWRRLWTGQPSMALRFSTATPLTPTGSSAPRHRLAYSLGLWPCFDGRDSQRSHALTQPAP